MSKCILASLKVSILSLSVNALRPIGTLIIAECFRSARHWKTTVNLGRFTGDRHVENFGNNLICDVKIFPGQGRGSLGIIPIRGRFSSLTSRPSELPGWWNGDMEYLIYKLVTTVILFNVNTHLEFDQILTLNNQPKTTNSLHSFFLGQWLFLLLFGSRPRITPTARLPSLVLVCLVVELV